MASTDAASPTKPATPATTEKVEKVEKVEKTEKGDKAEKAEKPAKEEEADKPRNVIQISLRFPVFRFVTATRNLLAEGHATVELSAIGNAITSVVSVAEILKKQNLVEVTKVETSLIEIQGRNERNATVAKLLVVVKKSAQFDELEKKRVEEEAKAKAEAEAAGEAKGDAKEAKGDAKAAKGDAKKEDKTDAKKDDAKADAKKDDAKTDAKKDESA